MERQGIQWAAHEDKEFGCLHLVFFVDSRYLSLLYGWCLSLSLVVFLLLGCSLPLVYSRPVSLLKPRVDQRIKAKEKEDSATKRNKNVHSGPPREHSIVNLFFHKAGYLSCSLIWTGLYERNVVKERKILQKLGRDGRRGLTKMQDSLRHVFPWLN